MTTSEESEGGGEGIQGRGEGLEQCWWECELTQKCGKIDYHALVHVGLIILCYSGTHLSEGFQVSTVVKNPPASAGDAR